MRYPSTMKFYTQIPWYSGVVVITTATRYSLNPQFKIYVGLNPIWTVLEISDGKNLWHRSQLKIRLKPFASQLFRRKKDYEHPKV